MRPMTSSDISSMPPAAIEQYLADIKHAARAEAFRAGAEAMRNTLAEIIAIKYDDEEIIKVIKKIPLPEMPEPKS